jgi:dTDP-glucose 4,6-dehydratase
LQRIVDEGAAFWPRLAGTRFFITGATGFFGRWLAESLFAADLRFGLGCEIVALSRDPEGFLRGAPHWQSQSTLRWLRGSVADLDFENFSGERFDYVIHLATLADSAATLADPRHAADIIAGGTRRMLELARHAGARRFLFTSSGSVYGPQPAGIGFLPETFVPVAEDLGRTPDYLISSDAKRRAEQSCLDAIEQHGQEVLIARGFTFAGPALPLRSKFAFGNFLDDALANRTIAIKGDGTPVRSYLYAAELATWLWAILFRGVPGRPYNVGSEQPVSLRQLAEMIRSELGGPGVTVAQMPSPAVPPHRYVPSTCRARDELGLKESMTLDEIIRRTAAWHRLEGED